MGYDGQGSGLAKPPFSGAPVDSAIAGTEAAVAFVRLELGQGGVDLVDFSPGDHSGSITLIHSNRIILS